MVASATARVEPGKKKPGRRAMLNREMVEEFVREVRRVYYAKWAIRNLGRYSERMFYKWLERGEKEIARMERLGLKGPKKTEAIYVYLVNEYRKAQASLVAAHSTNWQRGALGQERRVLINEKTGQPVLDGNGKPIVLQEAIPPDPRLSQQYLQAVDHESFGRKIRTEISTPDSGPTELRINIVKKRRVKKELDE